MVHWLIVPVKYEPLLAVPYTESCKSQYQHYYYYGQLSATATLLTQKRSKKKKNHMWNLLLMKNTEGKLIEEKKI